MYGSFLQFMCVGSLAGVTYLRYTVLTRSKKTETAVHCCDPALSVLVVLVSRNVFHVVSALQSIAFIHILFWLIRSLVDPTLAVFIVCGPLQLVTHLLFGVWPLCCATPSSRDVAVAVVRTRCAHEQCNAM